MLVLFFFFQFIPIFHIIYMFYVYLCLIMCSHVRNKSERILAVPQSFCGTNNDIVATYHIIDYNLPNMMWYDKRTCALSFRTGYIYDWCDLLNLNSFFFQWEPILCLKHQQHFIYQLHQLKRWWKLIFVLWSYFKCWKSIWWTIKVNKTFSTNIFFAFACLIREFFFISTYFYFNLYLLRAIQTKRVKRNAFQTYFNNVKRLHNQIDELSTHPWRIEYNRIILINSVFRNIYFYF